VDLKIQLKACINMPNLAADGKIVPYSLVGIKRYDDLRAETLATPRILVVLFLPKDELEWLEHTEEALSLRKCAYWVSLRGAEPSENSSAQTVTCPGLRSLTPGD